MVIDTLSNIAIATAWITIGVAIIQAAIYGFQLISAAFALMQRPPVDKAGLLWRRYSEFAPPIALIVPAFNEAANIAESVRSLVALEYPNFEVIVVNDGSTDQTLDILIKTFGLKLTTRAFEESLPHMQIMNVYSDGNGRLIVVDKLNGGKADAQNAGINVSRAPIFCVIDGDSLLEPDALLRVAQPFVDDPEHTVAVGGTIRIANDCVVRSGRVVEVRLPRKILPLFQVIEYLRAFLIARLAWSGVNSLMLISGAFSVFRRAEAVEVGGFTKGSLGEDLDIVVKLHRHLIVEGRAYRIKFIPEPVCWTEAPDTIRVLARQRIRWQKGTLEVIFRYRDMIFNPRYGRIGTIGFGQMVIMDAVAPFTEAAGYILVPVLYLSGLLSVDFLMAFTALIFSFGVFVSVGSLILAEAETRRFPSAANLLFLLGIAILENFGYRQLNNVWRLYGTLKFLRADTSWGEMPRTGFSVTKK